MLWKITSNNIIYLPTLHFRHTNANNIACFTTSSSVAWLWLWFPNCWQSCLSRCSDCCQCSCSAGIFSTRFSGWCTLFWCILFCSIWPITQCLKFLAILLVRLWLIWSARSPPIPDCRVSNTKQHIGVGAQSTLGTTFLPENKIYVWKIDKIPEFCIIFARKKMPEFCMITGQKIRDKYFSGNYYGIMHPSPTPVKENNQKI